MNVSSSCYVLHLKGFARDTLGAEWEEGARGTFGRTSCEVESVVSQKRKKGGVGKEKGAGAGFVSRDTVAGWLFMRSPARGLSTAAPKTRSAGSQHSALSRDEHRMQRAAAAAGTGRTLAS